MSSDAYLSSSSTRKHRSPSVGLDPFRVQLDSLLRMRAHAPCVCKKARARGGRSNSELRITFSTFVIRYILWPFSATVSTWLYVTLHYSTIPLLDSTGLYITLASCNSIYFPLHFSILALLYSSSLYIPLPWLYFTLRYSTQWRI